MSETSEASPPIPVRRASAGPHRSKASSEAILDAAEALLADAGYGGFSIEQVAKRAGAGKPTIYRWWPSKAALLLDVYARQKMHLDDSDTGSLEGDLTVLIASLWRFWRETPAGGAFRSIIAEAQSDSVAMSALSSFMSERRRQIAQAFERAAGRGDLVEAFDLEAQIDIVYGYNWGRLLTDRIADEPDTIAHAARQIARGVAKPDRAP